MSRHRFFRRATKALPRVSGERFNVTTLPFGACRCRKPVRICLNESGRQSVVAGMTGLIFLRLWVRAPRTSSYPFTFPGRDSDAGLFEGQTAETTMTQFNLLNIQYWNASSAFKVCSNMRFARVTLEPASQLLKMLRGNGTLTRLHYL